MTVIKPLPEALTRHDTEHGRWETDTCAPKRGLPHTNIIDRKMVTPGDESPMSRAIRAHEMMHAKVSPAHDWKKWIDRKIASEEALRVCEELRVNLLCQKAGFDMLTDLSDDGETADGERMAMMNDWQSAVMFAVATANTASAKKFLTGVRRHNRDWGKHLLYIQKKAVKQMQSYYNSGELANTDVDESTGLAPLGFHYTEVLAEWIDRIAGMGPPEQEEPESESTDDETETGESDGKPTAIAHYTPEVSTPRDFEETLKSTEPYHAPTPGHGTVPSWGTLVFGNVPLEMTGAGAMGRKRVATNTGRNPRHITRMITDPQKRIFDRKIRGRGGIVVLDVSGSMSFTRDQIRTIVENAPGATVLAYSWHRDGGPNAWILAKNGKMYREIDNISAGNGVDLPALEWAVNNRRYNEPIVWVSDGGVTGVGDGFHDILASQCLRFVKKHGIICAPNMDEAVQVFKQLARGRKPKGTIPYLLRHIDR